MRITPAALLKIAQDAAAQRGRSERDLLAIYLHGSLLGGEPLLGGCTDIDLTCVHNDNVLQEREIVRLTDEVHLDIAHHLRQDYRHARELRRHPWLGPLVWGCRILYDPQHFMDFTQAGVRDQFNRPDNVLARAQPLAEHARQIWTEFHLEQRQPSGEDIAKYLHALDHAANAIALLSGAPLSERRFLIDYSGRAEAVGRVGLYAGMLGLLGGARVELGELRIWLESWRAAYLASPSEKTPARLHPHRLYYYLRAFEALLESERPRDVLWPLLHTWTDAILALPPNSPQQNAWKDACDQLGLLGEGFNERMRALDAYLDSVEETLEVWEQESGG